MWIVVRDWNGYETVASEFNSEDDAMKFYNEWEGIFKRNNVFSEGEKEGVKRIV